MQKLVTPLYFAIFVATVTVCGTPPWLGSRGPKEGEFQILRQMKLRKLQEQVAGMEEEPPEPGAEAQGEEHGEHPPGSGAEEQGIPEGQELTPKEEEELGWYEWARMYDQEHYYRAPGGTCNTTEQIAAEVERLNRTGELNPLEMQKLERRNCLYYTNTYCAAVPGYNNPNVQEFRCICKAGRTWDHGACLAYHGQPCHWNNDCVAQAKCITENEEEEEEEDGDTTDDDTDSTTESTTTTTTTDPSNVTDDKTMDEAEIFSKVEFDEGVCICEDFSPCQRTAQYPPFHDESRADNLDSKYLHILVSITMFCFVVSF